MGVADIFLGIGTFGAAFEECGGAVAVRCENNLAADQVAALRAGEKSVNLGDIDDAKFCDVPSDVVRGVEIGLAAPNCQPFSLANPNARGLDDVRAWLLVDTPLTFAKFPNLLRTSVENVLGCRHDKALAYSRYLMS